MPLRFFAESSGPIHTDPDAVRTALRSVMDTAVQFARGLWYQRAHDLGIRGTYLQGVQDAEVRVVETIDTGDELGLVFELVNTAPHAGIVEHGHAAFHLPSRINWSGPRVKRGKNGPYLSIPLGHSAFQNEAERQQSGITLGTLRSMMPEDVYRRAKALRYTTKQNVGPVHNAAGQFVAADRYKTSGSAKQHRLGPTMPGPGVRVGPDGSAVDGWRSSRTVQGRDNNGKRLTNPAWQSDRFEGMIKTGSPGHTSFLTVRTITPRSVGWNIPARQGYGIARQVAYALDGPGGDRFRELLVQSAASAILGEP